MFNFAIAKENISGTSVIPAVISENNKLSSASAALYQRINTEVTESLLKYLYKYLLNKGNEPETTVKKLMELINAVHKNGDITKQDREWLEWFQADVNCWDYVYSREFGYPEDVPVYNDGSFWEILYCTTAFIRNNFSYASPNHNLSANLPETEKALLKNFLEARKVYEEALRALNEYIFEIVADVIKDFIVKYNKHLTDISAEWYARFEDDCRREISRMAAIKEKKSKTTEN